MIARWFWREWRSPSLLIVWLALSLAVACVLALGNISDRMEKGLSQQSREFMAGDRALRSQGAALLAAARAGFTDALQATAWAGAVLVLVAAGLVARLLRKRPALASG
ncbi:hypothetical protein [Escherichia coli]|uniref:hypothetical protein n=1 Tax=Escherichia coli TaxID=562 RepID=UPI000B15A5D7